MNNAMIKRHRHLDTTAKLPIPRYGSKLPTSRYSNFVAYSWTTREPLGELRFLL